RPGLFGVGGPVGFRPVGTEFLDDPGPGGLARLAPLAGELIGVDDLGTEPPEHVRSRALPRRDPAGEPDEQELARGAHTCAQSSPVFTSTTTGTLSGRADAMISRVSAETASTSSGGASKSSSSCTCRSMRARRPRAASAACMRTIAILIMSLAEPCTGAFIAMRSA